LRSPICAAHCGNFGTYSAQPQNLHSPAAQLLLFSVFSACWTSSAPSLRGPQHGLLASRISKASGFQIQAADGCSLPLSLFPPSPCPCHLPPSPPSAGHRQGPARGISVSVCLRLSLSLSLSLCVSPCLHASDATAWRRDVDPAAPATPQPPSRAPDVQALAASNRADKPAGASSSQQKLAVPPMLATKHAETYISRTGRNSSF
jgi:hypothetical protein